MTVGSSSLLVLAVISLALGSLVVQIRGGKGAGALLWRFTRTVLVLGLGALALISLALTLSIQGYRALTSEQLAATVEVEQLGEQIFRARLREPGSLETQTFDLAGDQLYMDARVLKWHPWANVLGLDTLYELERVGGRYTLLDDEQTAPRTVYSLSQERTLDLFELATRYARLSPLVDAEYGSGVFIDVEDGGVYALNVTSSGLVVRPQ